MDAAARDAHHLATLRELETILRESGFPTQLLIKADPLPQDALVTRITMPAPHPALEMVLSFYPLEPDSIRHSMLLQYYIQLPFDLDAKKREQYCLLLPDLNGKTVLGHFGLDIGSGKPHYRYVQALPLDRPPTQADIMDVVVVVGYTPALFSDVLAALAKGEVNAAGARRRLNNRYAA